MPQTDPHWHRKEQNSGPQGGDSLDCAHITPLQCLCLLGERVKGSCTQLCVQARAVLVDMEEGVVNEMLKVHLFAGIHD